MTHQDLIQLLQHHKNREYQLLCVLGALGVCAFDGLISLDEYETIGTMCQEWQVDYEQVSRYLNADATSVITNTLNVARKALSAQGRLGFLDVCIVAARSDDRLVFSEQLLLLTIADALQIPLSVLESVYLQRTGLKFPKLGDPSRLEYYQRSKSQRTGSDQQKTSSESSKHAELEELLEVLGLEPNCTVAQIRAAYRREALKHHPDKHPGDDEEMRKKRSETFLQIKTAYERLMVFYA
jgi:DnaJ-domain-containing protein 1